MAGDWIKVEVALPDKPEVWAVAGALNLDPDAVVGKLIRVFSWFNLHTENCNAPSVTKTLLDRLVSVTGFCDSLIHVGWMVEQRNEISLRNSERHNGNSAKSRALTNSRQSRHRNAKSVTKALPEKRREDSNTTTTRPTVSEVADYVQTRTIKINPQAFVDYYTANGWKVGRNSMKDWKAAVRTWEKNENVVQPVFGSTRKTTLREDLSDQSWAN